MYSYFIKLAILLLFQLCDLYLNSTSEYKDFVQPDADFKIESSRSNKIHLLLCTLQILAQLSSFTVMFSLLCETLPFQIGLIGVLTKHFSFMLCLQGLYLSLTILTSGLRLVSAG